MFYHAEKRGHALFSCSTLIKEKIKMARNSIARGKLVRRFGLNIFGLPKYDNLLSKKPNGPGVAKNARRKKQPSEYGRSLIEKQKIKYGYGVSEKQLRNLYNKAHNMRGNTGLNLLTLLERRFDNVVYKMGFAATTTQARQIIGHGHFRINGRRMNIPSYLVKIDDIISVREKEVSKKLIEDNLQKNEYRTSPDWITIDREKKEGSVNKLPERIEMSQFGDEQLVIEFYSR